MTKILVMAMATAMATTHNGHGNGNHKGHGNGNHKGHGNGNGNSGNETVTAMVMDIEVEVEKG